MARFAVILTAAGRSTRFGADGRNKMMEELDGRAIWLRAVEPFLNRDDVGQIIVTVAPEFRETFMRRYGANIAFLDLTVVEGGAERSDSVARALSVVDKSCDYVAVHDGARPCLAREWVDAVFAASVEHGAALLAIPVVDTLKKVDAESGQVVGTVSRENLYKAQTPQVFRRDWLIEAHEWRKSTGSSVTDDVQLLEAIGKKCYVVPGSPLNLKVTTPEDLVLARAALAALPQPERKGPANPFAAEESMWIGDFPDPPSGRV